MRPMMGVSPVGGVVVAISDMKTDATVSAPLVARRAALAMAARHYVRASIDLDLAVGEAVPAAVAAFEAAERELLAASDRWWKHHREGLRGVPAAAMAYGDVARRCYGTQVPASMTPAVAGVMLAAVHDQLVAAVRAGDSRNYLTD